MGQVPALDTPCQTQSVLPGGEGGGVLEVTDWGGRLVSICPGLKFSGRPFEPCKSPQSLLRQANHSLCSLHRPCDLCNAVEVRLLFLKVL